LITGAQTRFLSKYTSFFNAASAGNNWNRSFNMTYRKLLQEFGTKNTKYFLTGSWRNFEITFTSGAF
jgi:hypothetical protein